MPNTKTEDEYKDEHCASAFIKEIQVPHVIVKDLRLSAALRLEYFQSKYLLL